MTIDENKTQLIKLLLREWLKEAYAMKLHGEELYFAISEQCYCFTSTDAESVIVFFVFFWFFCFFCFFFFVSVDVLFHFT